LIFNYNYLNQIILQEIIILYKINNIKYYILKMNTEQQVIEETIEYKMVKNELVQIKNDIKNIKDRINQLFDVLKVNNDCDITELINIMNKVYDAKSN